MPTIDKWVDPVMTETAPEAALKFLDMEGENIDFEDQHLVIAVVHKETGTVTEYRAVPPEQEWTVEVIS